MKRIRVLLLLAAGLLPLSTYAADIEGVHLAEQIELAGHPLILSGAGVRTKFFFDIYVGALFLPHKVFKAKDALEETGAKRVKMVILYKEVERDKLVSGWTEGFAKNQSPEEMQRLQKRLDRFNGFFGDAHKGDIFVFDFMPDGSTHVAFNGKEKGVIQGDDFQQALLKVWLGDKPADENLKKAMLGGG